MTRAQLLPCTPEGVEAAARLLRAGEVVAIPTETVYGLAAAAFDEAALARVFAAKERPTFDPLIVHVDAPAPGAALDALAAAGLVRPDALDEAARARVEALAAAFWPGPLTLVLPKAPGVPDLATAGLATVGIRAPRHPCARALLRAAGPLAAPSANRFGRISPTTADDVLAELGDRIPAVLDGGPAEVGLESTVVSVAPGGGLTLLRPGGVAPEALAAAAGVPVPRSAPTTAPGRPLAAPGTLESHYAPARPLTLLPAAVADLTPLQRDDVRARAAGARALGLLAFSDPAAGERLAALVGLPVTARTLSRDGDLAQAARALFASLRALDATGADLLLAEPCPVESGLGHAIADRLRRASAPRSSG